MIFRIMLKTLVMPKRLINSNLCHEYNFFSMYAVVFTLNIIISVFNIKIDFFNEFNEIKEGLEIYATLFSSTIMLIQSELLILCLYGANKVYKGNKLGLFTIKKYIFPFYGMYNFLKNLFLLIFMASGIYNENLRLIISLCFRGFIGYYIYCLFSKYEIQSKKILFILFVYAVITLTNFV